MNNRICIDPRHETPCRADCSACQNECDPQYFRELVCGTKAVIKKSESDYRVVCATCGAGGTVKHKDRETAGKACVRDSARACHSCGAE